MYVWGATEQIKMELYKLLIIFTHKYILFGLIGHSFLKYREKNSFGKDFQNAKTKKITTCNKNAVIQKDGYSELMKFTGTQ